MNSCTHETDLRAWGHKKSNHGSMLSLDMAWIRRTVIPTLLWCPLKSLVTPTKRKCATVLTRFCPFTVDISLAKNETSIGGESKTVTKQFNLPRADYIVMHALNLDKEGFAELFYEVRQLLDDLV